MTLGDHLQAAWRPDCDQKDLLGILADCPPESLGGGVEGAWWAVVATSTLATVEEQVARIEASAVPWWEAMLPEPGGSSPRNAEEARGCPVFASLRDCR